MIQKNKKQTDVISMKQEKHNAAVFRLNANVRGENKIYCAVA